MLPLPNASSRAVQSSLIKFVHVPEPTREVHQRFETPDFFKTEYEDRVKNTEPRSYSKSIRTREERLDTHFPVRLDFQMLDFSFIPRHREFVKEFEQGLLTPEEIKGFLVKNPHSANMGGEYGVSPTMTAIFSNNPKLVKAFVESDTIDPTHLDSRENHALHWLAQPPTASEIAAEQKEAAASQAPEDKHKIREAKAKARQEAKTRAEEYTSNLAEIVELLKPTIETNRNIFCKKNLDGRNVSDYIASYMTNLTEKKLTPIYHYFLDQELKYKAEQKAIKAAASLESPSSSKTWESVPNKASAKKRKATKDLPVSKPKVARRAEKRAPMVYRNSSPDSSGLSSSESENNFVIGKGSRSKQDPNPFRRDGYTIKKKVRRK